MSVLISPYDAGDLCGTDGLCYEFEVTPPCDETPPECGLIYVPITPCLGIYNEICLGIDVF